MARTSALITVGADTRQLERDIQNALAKDFKFKGLNEKAFTQPLGRITGAANEFQKSLDASNARVIAFGASAGLIYTVQQAFTNLVRTTVEVEKSLADINVILNTNSQGLAQFGASLFNVARNTAQSFQTIAQAATELARQGLGVEETLKRTNDALILTRLSGLDVVSSVESLTATLNSFNKSALDSTTVINKLANVDAAFAVSSADLANAIQRVGSSAQDVGVSFDELLAIVTSVQQTTARGGAVIGNSLKTIFTRIQRTDVLDQLESLGLNVRDLQGNTLPAIQVLKELASTYDTLSSSQRSQIAESVGGVFQINVLKAALGDLGKEYSVYDRALKTSTSSTDEAIKRNEQLNKTTSALFSQTVANVTQLASTIGAGAFQPAIQSTLGNINKILEAINNQDSESIGGRLGEGILKGLSTFISGPGIVLLTAVIGKLTLDLAKFATSSLKTLLGVNQQSETRLQLQNKISEILSREPQLLAAINSKQITVLDVENKILNILREQNNQRVQAAALSSRITSGLTSRGVTVQQGQIRAKSHGFIPNYALSEVYGALSGGYMPGNIKSMNIPGEGQVIYNTAETVKKFPGMSQPAIMPPQKSKAGKEYRKNFISQNNFDPYASEGFVPNFNLRAIQSGLPMNSIKEQMIFRKYLQQGYEVLGGGLYKAADRESNASLFKDKTLVRQAGQILVKSDKKSLIVNQLRQSEKDAAEKLGKKEGPQIRSKLVYVYPDSAGGGTPFYTGGTSKKTGASYKFQAFPFPGGGEKIPDELYNNISNSLVKNAKEYISQVSTRPQLVDQKIFEQYVKSNLSRSAVEAATGQVFEASVKAAIKRVTISEISNFDLDRGELLAISKRFKSAGALKDFTAGDFKNSLSDSNLDSFADKIATKEGKKPIKKTKSAGFIPNFVALGSSIKRELAAGVPASKIRIGQDNRLMSQKNPLGIGVYNTEDEPNGIKQGISYQKNINAAKKAGMYSQGFIPNFAYQKDFIEISPSEGLSSGEAKQAANDLKNQLKKLVVTYKNGQISAEQFNSAQKEILQNIKITQQSQRNIRNWLQSVESSTSGQATASKQTLVASKSYLDKIKQLEKKAGSIFFGSRAESILTRRAGQGGQRGEAASAALARADERRRNVSSRIQGVGIGLSIGAPIVAQTIAAYNPQSKGLAATAEGVGSAASFAGIGASFGPWGAAIGGLVGVTVGLTKAFEMLKDKTQEYTNQAQDATNKFNRFNEDVQTFFVSREKLQGLRSGEIKGTDQDLLQAERQYRTALTRLISASGENQAQNIIKALEARDEDQLRSILSQTSQTRGAESSVKEFSARVESFRASKEIDKNFDSIINDLLRLQSTSGLTFQDFLVNNDKLSASLSELSKKSEIYSSALEDNGKNLDKLVGNKGLNDLVKFSETDLAFARKKINDPENQNIFQSTLRSTRDIFTSAEDLRKQEIKFLIKESAKKDLQNFGKIASETVNQAIGQGFNKDQAARIQESIKTIVRDTNDPIKALEKLIEQIEFLGAAGEITKSKLENLANGINFDLGVLSSNLQSLVKNANKPLPENIIDRERVLAERQDILDQISSQNFGNLVRSPGLEDYNLKRIVDAATIQSVKDISATTVEMGQREALSARIKDPYIEMIGRMAAQGGELKDIDFIEFKDKLNAINRPMTATIAGMSELADKINNEVSQREALLIFEIERKKLEKKFIGNTSELIDEIEKLKNRLLEQYGENLFSEEKAGIRKASYLSDIRANKFTGIDFDKEFQYEVRDYNKFIFNTIDQAISSLDGMSLTPEKREYYKSALRTEEQRAIEQGASLDTKNFAERTSIITTQEQRIKQSADELTSSIYNSSVASTARANLEAEIANIHKKYAGNVVLLDRATKEATASAILKARIDAGEILTRDRISAQSREILENDIMQEKNVYKGFNYSQNLQPIAKDFQAMSLMQGESAAEAIRNAIGEDKFSQDLAKILTENDQDLLRKIREGEKIDAKELSNFNSSIQRSVNSANTLRGSYDNINMSISDSVLREEASAKLQIKRTELENKYKDNLIKLDLATQAAGESLSLLAQNEEGTIFSEEFLGGRQNAREKAIRAGDTKPMDFVESFTDTFDYNTSTFFRDVQLGAQDTAKTIKSEFNNAFWSFAQGTETAGEAFTKMANNIIDKIQQMALEFSTNVIFDALLGTSGGLGSLFGSGGGKSLFGFKSGGLIKKFSTGGKVTGGSGTKDDRFAMLQGGEYVIKKSSVKKYGEEFLSNLNNGRIIKRDWGGDVSWGNSSASDRFNQSMNANWGGFGGNYTNPSYQVDPYTSGMNAIKYSQRGLQTWSNDVNSYLSSVMAFAARGTVTRDEVDSFQASTAGQAALAERGPRVGVAVPGMKRGGLMIKAKRFAGGGSAQGGEFSLLAVNQYDFNDDSFPTGGEKYISPFLSARAITDEGNKQNAIRDQREQDLWNYIKYVEGVNENNAKALAENQRLNQQIQDSWRKQQDQRAQANWMGFGMGIGAAGLKFAGFAKGGSPKDDIPALLMGGEYVIKKQAVDFYGKSFFDSLNQGRINKFADGGIVGASNNSSSNINNISNEKAKSSPINNINITVNVTNEGGAQQIASASTSAPNPESRDAREQYDEAKMLSESIKTQVIQVITDQQRPGGLLSSQFYSRK